MKAILWITDFVAALAIYVVNLFWGYYILGKMAVHWQLSYLMPEALSFQEYFGLTVVVGLFVAPALLSTRFDSKDEDPKNRVPLFIRGLALTLIVFPCMWLMSWLYSLVYFSLAG